MKLQLMTAFRVNVHFSVSQLTSLRVRVRVRVRLWLGLGLGLAGAVTLSEVITGGGTKVKRLPLFVVFR